ncbi:MAG: hypothetical protein HYZ25_05360 [Chloroflexi bacterium]|nr:hypothetical protein [Chloroflexota bacterium]
MISSSKQKGMQVSFSGGPHFKVSVSKVGGFYILSASGFDAGEIKFEIFDNRDRLIHTEKRMSSDGSISITWGAKLDAGTYKLSVTANTEGKQITEPKSFNVT